MCKSSRDRTRRVGVVGAAWKRRDLEGWERWDKTVAIPLVSETGR